MSEGINVVMLSGNIGSDPMFKSFDNGGAVLSFRMATNDSYVDRNTNERKQITDWHNITVNGAKRAKALSDILKKGSTVTVTGQLKTRSYEKDGEKKYVTEVRADRIVIAGGKASGGGAGGGAGGGDTDFNPEDFGPADDEP